MLLCIKNNILALARTACYNEKVIDVIFYCKHAAFLNLRLVKALQTNLNEGSRFLWQAWTLDSSFFGGVGVKFYGFCSHT